MQNLIGLLKRPSGIHVGTLAVAQYAGAAIGFLTSVIAARLLGPVDFGIAALAMAYPSLLSSFVGVKSGSVTTRYLASFRARGNWEELRGTCRLSYLIDFLVAVGAVLLVALTGWWVAERFLRAPHLGPLMLVSALAFPFSALSGTSMSILSVWGRFGWLALFQVMEKVLALGVVSLLVLWGAGPLGMVVGASLSSAVVGLGTTYLASRIISRDAGGHWWAGSHRRSPELVKEFRSMVSWNYLAVTFGGLVNQVPLLVLGRTGGPGDAGFLRLALNFVTVATYPEHALNRVAYPKLSVHWATHGWDGLRPILRSWLLHAGLPVAGLIAALALVLPLVIPVALGPGYAILVGSTQLMLLGPFVGALLFYIRPLYYAAGKIALLTQTYGVYALLLVGLSLWVIREWGFLGLAVLLPAGHVLYTLAVAFLLYRTARRRG